MKIGLLKLFMSTIRYHCNQISVELTAALLVGTLTASSNALISVLPPRERMELIVVCSLAAS